MRRLLVANRGEIAVRIIRAARDLGVETVAVTSQADRHALHARMADRAVCIGPAVAAGSYLRKDLLLHTALETDCDAVHPGYGFLSEDAEFAAMVEREGLVFVGPSADAIAEMGDKARARDVVMSAGIPVVPGSDGPVDNAEAVRDFGSRFGYPLLLKAKAGGGGRGMRVVENDAAAAGLFTLARTEAESSFGDGGIYVEKYLPQVRHVEIQVLADNHGHIVYLGERDCSIQRRHQKILEEAPSPAINDDLRTAMGQAAVAVAKTVRYTGAGTVEFLFDVQTRDFYFIETNTRIQVEHPITEAVAGLDLVAWQLRIADGEHLDLQQSDVELRGHAIEARITAEDATAGFLPRPGTIGQFLVPSGPGVRVDTHCHAGASVPPYYDSLLAKLIVHGRDRGEALRRLQRALHEFHIDGVASTVPFHRWLAEQPAIVAGDYTTAYLDHALVTYRDTIGEPKGAVT
ncbi:acetyl-CoA carboxylase biotin carboxylase subunit [Rhodococcus opacus]|uniref:acetyl-CoA carboxylase biotin carboxylase subunit n=1 Tax=Rhodococcus opacus TaxID=37919 RepID=UPI0029498E07|nr:acetyl-CoA carboxylase biotin carboxylase subunit [Rhodococcus opacus]MDV6247084.1 acetyl-CoA carboxylase biotin carboxylase subunit [Rhodococcus opacus]